MDGLLPSLWAEKGYLMTFFSAVDQFKHVALFISLRLSDFQPSSSPP